MCDTQNNNFVGHTKNDSKILNCSKLHHSLSKDTRQRNDSQVNACTNNANNYENS